MTQFSDFKLIPVLMEAITRMGYTDPTEIQMKSIPPLLEGFDLIGQSKTGSGKTAAYLLPTLNKIITSNGMAFVLVPTRELALQVEEFAYKLLGRNTKLRIAVVIGGSSMFMQTKALSLKPNLIIATPGRLVDHITRKNIKFDRLQFLILDEADRMLDMGFYPQIMRILPMLPLERQSTLFSATFSPEIRKLAKEHLYEPVEVSVGEKHSVPVQIDQQVLETTPAKKNELLLDQLNERKGSVLIFTKTKYKSERLAKYLVDYGHKATKIHGGLTLGQRKRAMEGFKSGQMRILVATDIAARGLDIAQVGHVINFDLPQNPEDYVHRVGRTGRAGAVGSAVSFITPEDRDMWRMILRYCGNKKI